MIPNNELLAKPIKLRNACIFYLGHIPTFLDMQLSKATGMPLCEPSHYPQIFERGIDPDVDNPDNCHAHSEIPDQWPPVEEILEYQAQVRRKVEGLYASSASEASRRVGRSLWIGLEHEIMHLETLLYMLLQSDNRMPPPRTVRPDFEERAKRDEEREVENQWFVIPEQEITVGLDDPEDNSGSGHFGWYVFRTRGEDVFTDTRIRDNEKPVRKALVRSFQAKGRPITNEEVSGHDEYCSYSLFVELISYSMRSISMLRIMRTFQLHGQGSMQMGICRLMRLMARRMAIRTVTGIPMEATT